MNYLKKKIQDWLGFPFLITVKLFRIKKTKKDELLVFVIPGASQETLERFKKALESCSDNLKGSLINSANVKIMKSKKRQLKGRKNG